MIASTSHIDVDILLATYNGAEYILQQLESIANQSTEFIFRIIVSDDGSTDNTVEIIKGFLERPDLSDMHMIYVNENRGVIKNFESLILKSDAPYRMFSDQDDIWLPHKIDLSIKALKALESDHPELPILVHTDLTIVGAGLEVLNSSMMGDLKALRDFSLKEGLMSSVATGCTMAFNKKLAELCTPFPAVVYMHDWWIFLVAKCYGVSYYLNQPTILYRQHGKNTLGVDSKSRSWHAIFNRIRRRFARNGMNTLYDTCFCQATALYDLRIRNRCTKIEYLEIMERFVTGKNYKSWKLKLHVIRFNYLPRGYISKLAVLMSLG